MAEEKKPGRKKAASPKKAAPAKRSASSAKKAAPTKKSTGSAKKAATKKATSSPRAATREPTHEEIAERAYQIHEREGGSHDENWLRAEQELKGDVAS
jgi:hypothetical protein